jgi:hypothetical protein
MSVTERMRSLGEHAKSSRQPPLKERRHAKASESAAKTVDIDEDIFDNGTARGGAAAVLVDDVAPKVVVEAKPALADDSAMPAEAIQKDDDTSAAKRAIIHEWQNWSALHSDELSDAKVVEYFFQHLQQRKSHLLSFASENKDASTAVQKWVRHPLIRARRSAPSARASASNTKLRLGYGLGRQLNESAGSS